MPVTKFGHRTKLHLKHFNYDDGYYYSEDGELMNIHDPLEPGDLVRKIYLESKLNTLKHDLLLDMMKLSAEISKIKKKLQIT